MMFKHDPMCQKAWEHQFSVDSPCGICASLEEVYDAGEGFAALMWMAAYKKGHDDALDEIMQILHTYKVQTRDVMIEKIRNDVLKIMDMEGRYDEAPEA